MKQPEQIIETNIGKPQGSKKSTQPQKQQARKQEAHKPEPEYHHQQVEEEVDDRTCTFCGRHDPNFNEETLDMHYWQECPMLTLCWECDQVIEIKQIEDHLLEECNHKDKYKYCSKCRSVLLKDEFEGHECLKPEPAGAARCPLCTEMVFPNDN